MTLLASLRGLTAGTKTGKMGEYSYWSRDVWAETSVRTNAWVGKPE